MEARKADIIDAHTTVLQQREIVERNDTGSREFEGLSQMQAVVHGKLEGPVTIDLNGVKLEVDLLGGHKTGYYLDQQTNYQAVSRFAKGANVLDAFCFLGGFSLHAAKAGAARVQGLDQSADAVAAATRNAITNGVSEICAFEVTNVF